MPSGGTEANVMIESIATSTYSQSETFLRETLQNACDQRSQKESQIDFVVDMFQVKGKQKENFDNFFSEARLGLDHLRFSDLRDSPTFEALVVADIGTNGLVGPLDASVDVTPSNFAGFFFRVGRQSSESEDGGTFGLGRTVLTNCSNFSTILDYSQFKSNGKLGKRFMGMAISGGYNFRGKKYTGRHWFGKLPKQDSALVEPFEGLEAEGLARDLGLFNYLGESTGFVAFVVGNSLINDPESTTLANKQRLEAIGAIQDAACLYGWPHMLGGEKKRSVNFSFRCDNKEIPEKDPKKLPVLSEFIKCYEALNNQIEGVESKEIFFAGEGGRAPTGKLAWLYTPIGASDLSLDKEGTIPVSSVALMRQANFVVKYLEVPQKVDQIATRGVFKSNKEFDSLFRKSEPVAHDDWLPWKLRLKPKSRNPIKQTLENIKENFKQLAGAKMNVVDGSASVVLGNAIGRLLDGLNLTGTPRQQGAASGSGGKSGRNIQIVAIGSPRISSSNLTHYQAKFKFQVLYPNNSGDTIRVTFNSYAILENGNPELEPPQGVEVPSIAEILLDGADSHLHHPIELNELMHLKIIEVTVSAPHGIGTTCRWKVAE